jgi:hypothetical protein
MVEEQMKIFENMELPEGLNPPQQTRKGHD